MNNVDNDLRLSLRGLDSSTGSGELALLSLTSKSELAVRDRLAFALASRLTARGGIKLGLQGLSPVGYRLISGVATVQLLGVSSNPEMAWSAHLQRC